MSKKEDMTFKVDADTEANAKISIATERQIAQLIGLPNSYQLTTWLIDIITTSKIGTKNEFLINAVLFRMNHLVILFDLIFNLT